jgi:hypothetical protein
VTRYSDDRNGPHHEGEPPGPRPEKGVWKPPAPAALLICLGGAAANVFFSEAFKSILRLPLYMDTLFTITATLVCGPYWGVFTGAATNLLLHSIFFYGWPVYLYTLCNMATALITAFFMRVFPHELRFSPGRAPIRTVMDRVIVFLLLSFSLCAAMSVMGGLVGVAVRYLSSSVLVIEEGPELLFRLALIRKKLPLPLVEILSRFPLNTIDRLVSVFAACGLAALISKAAAVFDG